MYLLLFFFFFLSSVSAEVHQCISASDPFCTTQFVLSIPQAFGEDYWLNVLTKVPGEFGRPDANGDYLCQLWAGDRLRMEPTIIATDTGQVKYNAAPWMPDQFAVVREARGQRPRFVLDECPLNQPLRIQSVAKDRDGKSIRLHMPGYYGPDFKLCVTCRDPSQLCNWGIGGTGCCGINCRCPSGLTAPIESGCTKSCSAVGATFCNNQGTCSTQGTTETNPAGQNVPFTGCLCHDSYFGAGCSDTCQPPCRPGLGRCIRRSDAGQKPPFCLCNDGWTGLDCSTPLEPCTTANSPEPCSGRGICVGGRT